MTYFTQTLHVFEHPHKSFSLNLTTSINHRDDYLHPVPISLHESSPGEAAGLFSRPTVLTSV